MSRGGHLSDRLAFFHAWPHVRSRCGTPGCGLPAQGSARGREELLRRADVPLGGAVWPLPVSPVPGSMSNRTDA